MLHWFPLMQRMVSHSMRKEEAQSVSLAGERQGQVVMEQVAILGLVRNDCLMEQRMAADCKGRCLVALEAVAELKMAEMIQKEHNCSR